MLKKSKKFNDGKLDNAFIFQLVILLLLFIGGIKSDSISSPTGFLYSNLDYASDPNKFWQIFIIMVFLMIMLIGILIFKNDQLSKIFTGRILSDEENNKRKESQIKTKRVSEDFFILFFILGLFCYGLPVGFRSESDQIKEYLDFYLIYIVLSGIYIALLKNERTIQYIRLTDEEEQHVKEYELGNAMDYLKIVIGALIGFIIAFLIGQIVLGTLNHGFLTRDGRDYLMFMAFASIPAEELVFRGLAMTGVKTYSHRLICAIRKVPEKEIIKDETAEKWATMIGIIFSSVSFGLMHKWRYGLTNEVIYLTCLGFILGFLQFKYSILSCYILHLLNNFSAERSAFLYFAPGFKSNYVLIGLLTVIMVFCFFRKNIKITNREYHDLDTR